MSRQPTPLFDWHPSDPIVDSRGRASGPFTRFLQRLIRQSGGQGQDRIAQLVAGRGTLPPQLYIGHCNREGLALEASDDGTRPVISVSAHALHVSGQIISLDAGDIFDDGGADLAFNHGYYVYYADPLWRGGDVIYQVTDDPADIISRPDCWLLGTVTTPAAPGNPPVTGEEPLTWQIL